MAFEEIELKAPQAILDDMEKDAERVKAFIRTRNIRLSDSKAQSLELDLHKKYEAWKRNTMPLHRKLVRLNDLLEGVVEETNSPFEGASNMTTGYALGIVRTFQSTFNKTAYQDPELFTPVADPDAGISPDELTSLENAVNHSFSVKCNGLDILKEGTIPAARDGTLVVSGGWERRIETAHDVKLYTDVETFANDYPDAASAGVSEEAYGNLIDRFIIDPELELQVKFSYDFVAFDGVEYEINSFSKFVWWPTFAKSINRMEVYGKQYQVSESDLKIGSKRGKYYERGVNAVLKMRGSLNQDAWDKSRDYAEGVRSMQDDYRPVVLADLVYKADLNDDGIPEKYLLTYAPDHKTILAMQHYPLRRNIDFCVAFRLACRENRFPGHSLVGNCEDLFNLLDSIHRHRNNIRLLVASPVLLVQEAYKELIDLGRAENVIRPGVTFWVKDVNESVKQLPLQNFDQPGNSLDEENLITRYVELVFGPTQGLSGKQTTDDPHAPARKTQMLLMQANQRIDDYMDEFRKSLPELAKLHCALLYQYASGDKISYEKEGGQPLELDKKLLANNLITWQAKRRSVTLTPEFAMARTSGLIQTYASLFQLLTVQDPIATELWNRIVRSSGEPDIAELEKKINPMMGMGMPGIPGMPVNGQAPGNPGAAPSPTSVGKNQNMAVTA